MPQLDIFSYTEQIFWLIITFSALYIIMARFALPRIGGVIEQRRDRIVADIAEAERLKEEANQAEEEFIKIQTEAKIKARNTENQEQENINQKIKIKNQQLEKKLSAKITEAEIKLQNQKKQIIQKIDNIILETTADIVKKLANLKIPETEIKNQLKNIQSER